MFSLISGSLQGSVGRFLTFELGAGNTEKLKMVFSTSFLVIMIGLSLVIVLAAETLGLWYLYHKMVIPAERLSAAFWCFQFSVVAFVLSLLDLFPIVLLSFRMKRCLSMPISLSSMSF